jgi:hypothetical protein
VATYREVVAALSPNHYWYLDETVGTNANDEIGTSDGTYANTPTLGQPGLIAEGTSVAFARASSEGVTVPNHADWDNATSLSWAMVIKFASLPSAGQYYEPISHVAGGTGEWYVEIRNDSGRDITWGFFDLSTGGAASWTPSTATRYHLGAVWTGSVVRFYVDGAQQGSDITRTGTMGDGTGTLTIGSYGASADYFDGTIDEVAFWKNTALTAGNFSDMAAAMDNSPVTWPPADSDNSDRTIIDLAAARFR